MGTYLTDFVSQIRRWINVQNVSRLPDADVISWVRMAEERFNMELRTAQMMATSRLTFSQNSETLPADFNQVEYIRNLASGLAYEYITSDEYWRRMSAAPPVNYPGGVTNTQPYISDTLQQRTGPVALLYTIIGNSVYLCPSVDAVNGTAVELCYVQNIPPLTDAADNWLHAANPRLYLFATCALSAPYLDEDNRATLWDGEATARIGLLNQQYRSSKLGGGPLRPRRRSFG